jgi:hypothetical protein
MQYEFMKINYTIFIHYKVMEKYNFKNIIYFLTIVDIFFHVIYNKENKFFS